MLIVEDEPIVAKDLQETLMSMGYDAYAIAASGEEALTKAEGRLPDVVLMDVRLEGAMDGIETAEAFAQRFGLRVIYLTSHSDVVSLDRAKQTRPHAYLLKPVKAVELRGAIEIAMFKREHGS